MQIPLATFENSIDQRIVNRGYNYFTGGFVQDMSSSGKGDYEVIVAGSEDYEVKIQLKDGFVQDYNCDCPFDSLCKHIVAVLFTVREAESEISVNPSSKKPGNRLKITELIDRCPEQELKEFLKAYSSRHVSFVTEFLNAFPSAEISDSVYRKQLKAIIRKVSDRDGFIDWNAARRMAKDLNRLMNIAEQHLAKGEREAVLAVCIALMEELIGVLNYADDSSGIIGGTIDVAFEMLAGLVRSDSSFAGKHLWNFFVKQYEQKTFEGWDWHLGLLGLLVELADTDEQIGHVQAFLNEKGGSEYDRESKELLQFNLIVARGDISGAEKFAKKHLANHYLRERLIKDAITRKDFDAAIEMAEEGIRKDEKSKPGLAKQWQNSLLDIYIGQLNTEKIIEFSRLLFVDGFVRDRDYYSLLKEHIHPDQWESELESLVKRFSHSGWNRMNRIADIYIRENKFDKLLELVTSDADLQVLKTYDKHLSKKYSSELAELYARELPGFLEANVARNHYQEACRILNRIGQLGRRELADQLIDQFKKTYPQRRALVEELNRL